MRKRIIDNHTIKVFVTRNDLKRNGITALDLLGDHNQIEQFFYKILDKVDTQHLFTSHEPLTFRVIPNKIGLDIIISCRSSSIMIKNGHVKTELNSNRQPQQSLNYNVIKLNRFEDFIQIAHLLKAPYVVSRLYRYQSHYYLELSFNVIDLAKTQRNDIKNQLAIAYEYGDSSIIPPSKLKKEGKIIMKDHALEQGRYYFR